MMRVALAAVLAALVLQHQPLHAQQESREAAREITEAPLQSVKITGNQRIPAEKILALVDLPRGRTVSRADFDAAQKRLMATGAFETVGYEYRLSADRSGFDFIINVHEIGEVYPYRFQDLGVPEETLRSAVRAQEPLWGDEVPINVLTRYVDAIVQAGVKAAVTWKADSSSGRETIVFKPAAVLPNLADIRFTGNQVLPASALLRPISDVAVGIPYTEQALRERLDLAIRPLYEARGRLRVAFPKITVEQAEKVDGVVATVTVDEGQVYRLGEVGFAGVAESETAPLQKLADLRKGDIANFDDVKAAAARVEKKYRDEGYLHVSSKIDRDVHDGDHSVNLQVMLDLGAQYRFGKLTIQGLDILAEPEIRRAFGAMEGKPYQPGYADAFLDRLRAEKVFDNLGKTTAEAHVNEAGKTVDTTLIFTGAGKADQASKAQSPKF